MLHLQLATAFLSSTVGNFFRCFSTVLFDWTNSGCPLAGLVLESVGKCDVDVRRDLYSGIILTGQLCQNACSLHKMSRCSMILHVYAAAN